LVSAHFGTQIRNYCGSDHYRDNLRTYDFGEGWEEKVTGWLSEEEYAQDN